MANLKDLIVNGSARILGTLYAPDIKNTHRVTEFIVGTQSATTGAWTGKTQDTALYDGKNINYFLPYAGSGNASLNLTLADGTTTTSAKPVYLWGTSYVTTHYPANSCINMTYNATKDAWFVNADRDNNNDTYDRVKVSNNVHASAACTNGKLICGNSTGYKDVAAAVTFDIDYPLLYCATAIASGNNGTNNYTSFPGVNLATTKGSWTGTQWSTVYLVGTLSGKTFTIDSSVFTTTAPTTADGKVYIPLGVLYSTNQVYFISSKDLFTYRNGSFQLMQPDLSGYQATSTAVTHTASTAVGSTVKPVYVDSNGAAKALTATVGSTIKPVYLNGGTVTAITANIGNTITPMYMASGELKALSYTIAKSVPSDANFSNTTYTAGTGLSLSGTQFKHSNSVTSGTAGTTAATSGSTLAVPYVTYDACGHVTAAGTHTHTITVPNIASNKVTAMTSYAKATTAAAITTGDSLNVAIGKLEYKIDNSSASNVKIKNMNGSTLTPTNPSASVIVDKTNHKITIKGQTWNAGDNDLTDVLLAASGTVTSLTIVTHSDVRCYQYNSKYYSRDTLNEVA